MYINSKKEIKPSQLRYNLLFNKNPFEKYQIYFQELKIIEKNYWIFHVKQNIVIISYEEELKNLLNLKK